MKQRAASSLWNHLRKLDYNATARFMEKGLLAGEHVIEIEPGPALGLREFTALLLLAQDRKLDLSYGKSPRRVLVLS